VRGRRTGAITARDTPAAVAFPEGSPTHPSYPAAHACNAGACATILKAFFNANYVFPHPVEATADASARELWRGAPLTLGDEIDKLAGNIALGRDAAGVHYRSDSVRGLFVLHRLRIHLRMVQDHIGRMAS